MVKNFGGIILQVPITQEKLKTMMTPMKPVIHGLPKTKPVQLVHLWELHQVVIMRRPPR